MLEIQYLMASSVAALVFRHVPAAMADHNLRRPHYPPHSLPRRPPPRIPVGLHLHPSLSFHSALLVAFRRIAVLALVAPMRAECDYAVGFHPLVSAQNLLHHTGHVLCAAICYVE